MTRRFIGFYVLILLSAFLLRVHQLDQFPPGLSNDEAVNVIDAFHIARSGNFPIYEEDQGRAEPLYRIVLAVGAAAWGSSVWGMRLVSVFLSLLTIASIGWMTRQVLRDLPASVRHVGAAGAMIALTVMIGDLTLSRSLFRPNLQLLGVTLTIGFVLRALETGSRRDFVLAGLLAGLTLYTYTSAWVFPLGFLGLGVTLAFFYRRQWRQWLPGLMLTALSAALIAAPVLYLAVTYPRAVFGRAQALTGGAINIGDLALRGARQFYAAGDVNPQYNVASVPIISAALLPLFLLGSAALLLRLRSRSALLLLTLLLVFNLPVLLSNEIPHGLRIANEYVIVAAIIGVGISTIMRGLRYLPLLHADTARLPLALLALSGLLLVHSLYSWGVYRDYWQQADDWKLWNVFGYRLNHNEWFFRPDRRDLAAWIKAQTVPILMPIDELEQETTRSWLLPAYPTVTTAGADFQLPPQTELLLPWSLELGDDMTETRSFALLDHGEITLLPPLSQPTHAALLALLPQGDTLARAGVLNQLGIALALPSSFQLAYAPAAVTGSPVASYAGDELRLLRWYGSETLIPGATQMPVTLIWSPQRQIGHEYAATLQLLTPDYRGIAETNHLIDRWLYPSTQWKLGDAVPDSYVLSLPPSLAPGAYRLAVSLYFASYPLLPATSIYPSDLTDKATIGWIKVPQPQPVAIPADAQPIGATIADAVALDAALIADDNSGTCTVDLFWRGLTERPPFDATIFVHLLDSSGTLVAQQDSRPWDGQYPTVIWGKDEVVETQHLLACGDLNTASTLSVGMYTLPPVQNLPAVLDGTPLPNGVIPLGNVGQWIREN